MRTLCVLSPECASVLESTAGAEKFARGAELFFKYPLVTDIDAHCDRRLAMEIPLHLRLVVINLHPPLPVKIRVECIVCAPGNQKVFRMRLRVIAHKQVVIVGVRATIKAHVRTVIASAANGRVIVAKVTSAHVVVRRIDKPVLFAIERTTLVRKEKVVT